MEKPNCDIEFWCVHKFHTTDEQLASLHITHPNTLPIVVTGMVIRDEARRPGFAQGECCRSSLALTYVPDSYVETKNSRYSLIGPGRESYDSPVDYGCAVAKTMALVTGIAEETNGQLLMSVEINPK